MWGEYGAWKAGAVTPTSSSSSRENQYPRTHWERPRCWKAAVRSPQSFSRLSNPSSPSLSLCSILLILLWTCSNRIFHDGSMQGCTTAAPQNHWALKTASTEGLAALSWRNEGSCSPKHG